MGETDGGENQIVQEPIPLQHVWCFWQDKYDPAAPNTEYATNLNQICEVSTVQTFWSAFNNIPTPDNLANRNSLHFFKKGVKPIWEDPKNEFGGAWSFRVKKEDTSKIWPEMLMLCIGQLLEEKLSVGDELIGVSVGARWNSDIIQIWNLSAKLASDAKIMEAILLAVDPSTLSPPFYKAHKDHTDFQRK